MNNNLYTIEPTMQPTMQPNNIIESTIQPIIYTDNLSNYKYLKTKKEQSTIFIYYIHKINNSIIKINMYNL